jgi:pyocin large subunit-like protein
MNRPFIQKRIDAALNQIIAERDTVLRLPAGDDRSARLAALFDREADLWGELHEATTSPTQARAAIRARQYATSEATRLRSTPRSRVSARPSRAA